MQGHDSVLKTDGRVSVAGRDRCSPPKIIYVDQRQKPRRVNDMGNSSGKKKAEFLGMPYGTACGRLKKMVMFKLLQALNEDKCFRCGEAIENVSDLSLEHKEPWLHISQERFWDLDNISFSHLTCNTKHRRYRNGRCEKKGPAGMAWCISCQQFVPEDRFGKNPREDRDRVLRGECNDCRKKKGWDHKNRKSSKRKGIA